eukprot:1196276-Prorocentrum_minimum.AAC.7
MSHLPVQAGWGGDSKCDVSVTGRDGRGFAASAGGCGGRCGGGSAPNGEATLVRCRDVLSVATADVRHEGAGREIPQECRHTGPRLVARAVPVRGDRVVQLLDVLPFHLKGRFEINAQNQTQSAGV